MANEIVEQRMINETRIIVEKFLETNASDKTLEQLTGYPASTIGRRLNNKERIMRAFPENGEELYNLIIAKRQENLQKGKIIGSQKAMLNYGTENQKIAPLLLSILAKSEKIQYQILKNIALTFRAQLPLLSELFQIDEDELLKKLEMHNNLQSVWALDFLFKRDIADQEKAKRDIYNFYNEFLKVRKTKDVVTLEMLRKQIFDYDVTYFLARRQGLESTFQGVKQENYTDKEIEMVLRYQLKYALSGDQIQNIFGINRSTYISGRLPAILEKNPELRTRYEYLCDCHTKGLEYITRNGTKYGQY